MAVEPDVVRDSFVGKVVLSYASDGMISLVGPFPFFIHSPQRPGMLDTLVENALDEQQNPQVGQVRDPGRKWRRIMARVNTPVSNGWSLFTRRIEPEANRMAPTSHAQRMGPG